MLKLQYHNNPINNEGFEQFASNSPSVSRAPGPRLRILMVGMHLTKTRGGITTLTADILESSFSKRFEVRYIATQAEDYGFVKKVVIAITSLTRLIYECIFFRPAAVYVHLGSNVSLYREGLMAVISNLMGSKVIVHFHAGDIGIYLNKQPRLGKDIICGAIRRSDCVIAVSAESAKDILRNNVARAVITIPNTIDTNEFLKILRPNGDANPDKLVRLLFVGAAGKLKGERDLICAVSSLRQRGLPVKAMFVGYGMEAHLIEIENRGLSNEIEHFGPVDRSDRLRLFKRADIFVLPTYAEAMPISVIEAMAAGLPVVSTRVGGIPELIADGKEGLLFESGDIIGLTKRIEKLAVDVNLRLQMGIMGRKKIESLTSFENYIDRLAVEVERVAKTTI